MAVIAGFRGINPQTAASPRWGRGGSDTSAVAVAAAIKADRCDFYTDVDGVYTPIRASCRRPAASTGSRFEDMLELASHPRGPGVAGALGRAWHGP